MSLTVSSRGHQKITHRAWLVAAVTVFALMAAAAFRSSTGVLIVPLESEFGWTRTQTSGAVTVNLVWYGLTAPFAAAMMQRFGLRRVIAGSLFLIALGSGLTLVMTHLWQLWLAWGLLVGTGTGAMALVMGAIIANRWFVQHRGLVMGMFSASSATGQLVFLPVIAPLVENPGWRWAAALTMIFALCLVPLIWGVIRDFPADVGLRPYGAPSGWRHNPPQPPTVGPARAAVSTLFAVRGSGAFWILFWTFWICGWSTNGLIGTHFVAAAHDHGMPATASAGLLALVGVFDIVGTLASGWLTDRVDPRKLLFYYYFFRGLALLFVPWLLGPTLQPPLLIFVVLYGLDWVATVPPTVALCRQHFGVERAGVVFGWVFAAHMVGAGVAATYAGVIRQVTGDYFWAWITAGILCVVAAASCLAIQKAPAEAVAANFQPE
jgi:MFS family permease